MGAVRVVTRIQDQDDAPTLSTSGQVLLWDQGTQKFISPAAADLSLSAAGINLKNKLALSASATELTIGSTDPILLPTQIKGTATSSKGYLSVGNGPFDGATAGFFTGNALGTLIAANSAAGFAGSLIDLQIAGSSYLRYRQSDGLIVESDNTNSQCFYAGRKGAVRGLTVYTDGRVIITNNASNADGVLHLTAPVARNGNTDNKWHSGLVANTPLAPTVGNSMHSVINVGAVINYTGGASGPARGIVIDPVMTSVPVDWAAIEISAGKGNFILGDANNLATGTVTGSYIAKATDKLAFYGNAPVLKPAAIVDASGGATVDAEARTAINSLLASIRSLGLITT